MSEWWSTSVLEPVCTDCGADCTPLRVPVECDWRDDRERILGENAVALQLHRHLEHPVLPKIGDVVVYFSPWRGMVSGQGPFVVRGVRDHDLHAAARELGADLEPLPCVKYWLADPGRPNYQSHWSWPSTGDPRYPVTFEILTEYVAPVREVTLFDSLGDEWALDEVPA